MASKLVPSDPAKVMVIRDVIPNVITTLSVPFWRHGLIKVGGRGTIVRLQTGALAVFSPVALTDEVKRKVEEMGEVKYIAALDVEHHIFLGPWHQAYPNAQIMAPDTLPEKRDKQKNDKVPFAFVFKKDAPITSITPEFDAEFDYEYVYAHMNKEIVFNHRPTRTAISADLIFDIPATEQFSKTGEPATSGIATKIFSIFTNTKGTALWQQRLVWYGVSSSDRVGFAQSIARMNKWDFDRFIPCHGDVIETGGKGIFQKIFKWHLELAEKEGAKS